MGFVRRISLPVRGGLAGLFRELGKTGLAMAEPAFPGPGHCGEGRALYFTPGQWHRISTQISVPPDTDFLMVCIRVNKGSTNTGAAEFTRCFADDVALRLLPKTNR